MHHRRFDGPETQRCNLSATLADKRPLPTPVLTSGDANAAAKRTDMRTARVALAAHAPLRIYFFDI